MYDVVVYYSSLPRIADHDRKAQILKAFAVGAKAAGANTYIQRETQVVPAKLGVFIGWVGQTFSGPHIYLRQSVIDAQKNSGNHCMPIDGSCFKFADPMSQYVRYSLDGVYYNEKISNYANSNATSEKWNKLKQDLNLTVKPWQKTGEHYLICLQRDGGWNMKGANLDQWLKETIRRIRNQDLLTPILIRPHPKRKYDLNPFLNMPNIYESAPESTLEQDLMGAKAAVFYNSSSAVAAILAGIPAFVTDEDAVAWNVANHNIDNILQPQYPDREQWLYDLAACHWSDEELRQGLVWKHFLPYLK